MVHAAWLHWLGQFSLYGQVLNSHREDILLAAKLEQIREEMHDYSWAWAVRATPVDLSNGLPSNDLVGEYKKLISNRVSIWAAILEGLPNSFLHPLNLVAHYSNFQNV